MIATDLGARITHWNRYAEELSGWAEEEVLGRTIQELMGSEAAAQMDHYIAAVMARGSFSGEIELDRRDGSKVRMLAIASVMRDPDGDPVGLVGIGIDLTETRNLEREIVEIAERERVRIGQDLHDDLGQKLTGLGLLLEVLDARVERGHPVTRGELAELRDLVAGAAAQTRFISRGLLPVETADGSLEDALIDLCQNSQRLYGIACGCDVSGSIAPAIDARVAQQLYHIAQEAVTNAVKHGDAREVVIKIEVGGAVVMTVTDNGAGMPDALPADRGLGVSIMQRRARLIGAELTFGGHAGRGTLVTCRMEHPPDPASPAGSGTA